MFRNQRKGWVFVFWKPLLEMLWSARSLAAEDITDCQPPMPRMRHGETSVMALADNQELYKLRERARYYWTKALEADESAVRTRNPEARARFLRVAEGWRIMAERTELES